MSYTLAGSFYEMWKNKFNIKPVEIPTRRQNWRYLITTNGVLPLDLVNSQGVIDIVSSYKTIY